MKLKVSMSFPLKLTILIAAVFSAMLVIFSSIFYYTSSVMEAEAIKHIEYNVSEISQGLDEVVLNVYNVSDTFALDKRLLEYTDGTYDSDPTKKRFATTQISNVLFASYDLLRNNEKMAAFYNNSTGEVFNFLDPNADDNECREILEAMDINSTDKLAKFFWYPVRDNFLKHEPSGDIRKDKAVIGTRRVFSRLNNSYIGVHIFALAEDTLYKKYSEIAKQYNSKIYIINEAGALLSSSEEDALKNGIMDDDLKQNILKREYDRFDYHNSIVFVRKSKVNDWLTVISVPHASLTDAVDKMHKWIFLVLILFALLAIALIYFFYKRFMHPISALSTAMQKVDNGDLNSYVSIKSQGPELSRMINCYNSMLESINRNITEKLNMEKHKKQLEMDILMNQINPHFLYNTLETIVWKSTEAGHPDIGRIAAALGRMYRLSISGGNLFVSLHHELEHVNAYIKIQQSRYDDSFVFETNADYSRLRDVYTLKMLLQPLIENSLSHGMEGLNRKLHIRLSVKIFDSHMRIRISDTGLGMDKQKLLRIKEQIATGIPSNSYSNTSRKKSTGIGMHNVSERLRIYFKEKASISVWSRKNIGTVIELILPIISETEAKKLNNEKNN